MHASTGRVAIDVRVIYTRNIALVNIFIISGDYFACSKVYVGTGMVLLLIRPNVVWVNEIKYAKSHHDYQNDYYGNVLTPAI